MPWRMVAYSESVDAADAFNAITPVTDPIMAIDGDFYRIPATRNQIIGYAVLLSSGGTNRARITSPTLSPHPIDIEPRVQALVFGSPPEVNLFPESPFPVVGLEGISVEQRSDPAAAERQYAFLWLSDGPVAKVNGPMLSVRFTAAIALAAGTWVNGAITLAQSLPVGNYNVVGMRVLGTNLVAARLVFTEGGDRPGAVAINAVGDYDPPLQRFGGLGVWGSFSSLFLPSLDALGVTDTTQTGFLDLIRTG